MGDELIFTVYKHTSPSGKSYVGITSKPVSVRWGAGGCRYKDNKHFWNAICKYGWDNFTHEILATKLSKEDACKMEETLIHDLNLMNPLFGYNNASGGQHATPSDEVREFLREHTKQIWKDDEIRSRIVSKLIGHECSEETRRKISLKNSGRKHMKPSPLKGRKLSAERIEKLRNHPSWIKGKTKYTDPIVAEYSKKLTGRIRSEEHCKHISESHKLKYELGYKPQWFNNGIIEIQIDVSKNDPPEGFVRGRLNSKCIYVYKDDISIKISECELNTYIANGWVRGRPSSVHNNLKRSNNKYTWIYNGESFENAKDLALYLNEHGYTEIVSGTITSLYNKGFSKSLKYKSLDGKIERVSNENKKD